MSIARILWWLFLEVPELLVAALLLLFGTLVASLEPDEMPGWLACTWVAIAGLVGGAALGVAIPTRVLPEGPFVGVSLVVAPVACALAMEVSGRRTVRGGGSPSHLGPWYGGAILGLGFALGRLVALWQHGAL